MSVMIPYPFFNLVPQLKTPTEMMNEGERRYGRKSEAKPLENSAEAAQDFISKKIESLVGEGYEQKRAEAIAYSEAREKGYSV